MARLLGLVGLLRTRRASVALATIVVVVVPVDIGSVFGWWGWLPAQLHSAAASMCAALVVVHLIPRQVAAVGEAYRLGIRHGRREQRRACEVRCGHTCGSAIDQTGEIPAVSAMPVAAGGGVVVKMPTQRLPRHRR